MALLYVRYTNDLLVHFHFVFDSIYFSQGCASREKSTPAGTCSEIVGVQISHLIWD